MSDQNDYQRALEEIASFERFVIDALAGGEKPTSEDYIYHEKLKSFVREFKRQYTHKTTSSDLSERN